MVAVVVAAIVALHATYYSDPFYDGTLYHAASLVFALGLGVTLWAVHRVLVAWIRWPSRYRGVRWVKTVVAFLLTDPQYRYHD